MRRLSLFYILFILISYINAQVVENPVFDRTDVPSFRVKKIEIQKDTTYIYCTFSAAAASWANISKDMYLYAKKTNNKYPILRCEGLPFSPQKKTFINDKNTLLSKYFSYVNNMTAYSGPNRIHFPLMTVCYVRFNGVYSPYRSA